MKVLLVTQADPDSGMTGVATYVRDLANSLAGSGHDVAHLFSEGHGPRARPHLHWAIRQGRMTATVRNSPLLRPFPPERLMDDATHPMLEGLLEEALLRIRPDLVHIHDLAGIPAAFIEAARCHRFPVVVTLHDFWPFCRKQFLLQPGLVTCEGSAGGRSCTLYCTGHSPGIRRLIRRLEAHTTLPGLGSVLQRARRLRQRLRGGIRSQFVLPPRPPRQQWPDVRTVGAYAARESSMREALLQANRLLPVSDFVKAMYVRHGYPADRLRVLPISAAVNDRVRRRLREFRGYPVRFGYLGRVSPLKGAHVLAEAASGVSPEHARFTFYGAVGEDDRRFLIGLAGSHPGVQFAGRYTPDQLGSILDEVDIVVLPSIARETRAIAGLEAQAAGAPIIASDGGALPEYVRHEINGLLFSPGSVVGLRAQILRIIQEPGLIARMSRNVPSVQPMSEHARQILQVYEEEAGRAIPGDNRPGKRVSSLRS